jgi:DNA-binding NarL/FixJ family response regulator
MLASVIADLHEHSGSYCVMVQVVDGSSLGQNQRMTDLLQDVVKSLKKREVEILELAVNGYSNKRIAQDLFITIETVKSHRKNIVNKAGVRKIDEIKNLLLKKSLR